MTGACARLTAIWDVPHHTDAVQAAAVEKLKTEIHGLPDEDLALVIEWAFDRTATGCHRFWIIFAISHIERESRYLACKDCASEVRGYAGERWRYRVIHSATCPGWREYQAGRVSGPIPCGAVVTHRGPYRRRPAT